MSEIKEDEQIGSEKQISTEYTKSPSPNPPNTMIITTTSELSNTPELTKQSSDKSNGFSNANDEQTMNSMRVGSLSFGNSNNSTKASSNSMLNANIINNNNTPISPIIGSQQQQTHTHNITINNSNKEYKELTSRMNAIENKIDTISNVVLLMQKQINNLNNNIEYIKQQQVQENEYKDNVMYLLNEMRNEITNIYTYNTHANNGKTNTHTRTRTHTRTHTDSHSHSHKRGHIKNKSFNNHHRYLFHYNLH